MGPRSRSPGESVIAGRDNMFHLEPLRLEPKRALQKNPDSHDLLFGVTLGYSKPLLA